MQIQSLTCNSPYYLRQRAEHYFAGPEHITQTIHPKKDRFYKQSTTAKNVHFTGQPKPPSKLKNWLHKVTPWLQNDQNPMLGDFPLKFRSSTIIPDGTIVPFSFEFLDDTFEQPKITKTDLFSVEPKTVINILVDRSIDPYLRHYLNSADVKQLAKNIPNKKASIIEEIAFAKRLGELTKQQFYHLGIPPETQKVIQNLDNFPKQTESQRKYYEKLYPMKPDQYGATYSEMGETQPLRLLGNSMRRGVGVCCHQSLLNKITLDYIKQKLLLNPRKYNGLGISYKMGLIAKDMSTLFSQEEQHAWNVIEFPSGRKYILDSINSIYAPYTQKNAITIVRQGSETVYYISWNRLLKVENPNYKPSNATP